MSSFSDNTSDWNFRIFEKRLIVVKTKNAEVQKIAVLDVLTNLMFAVEVPEPVLFQVLAVNREYLANLKVFTSKKSSNVDKKFTNFFEALDIDQGMDDFIKAFWAYPTKIRFELTDTEEP